MENNNGEEMKKAGVYTDRDFKALVRNIANGSAYTKENVEIAAKYLWHPDNWKRLGETPFGHFMREVENKVPDLILRSEYRKEVLASTEHE